MQFAADAFIRIAIDVDIAASGCGRYRHPQAIGFEVVLPGEALQFIHGQTLQNTKETGRAQAVTKLDEEHLLIRLEAPLPEGIEAGDALENADWYPSVSFCGNTIRHNRARGSWRNASHRPMPCA